MGNSFGYAFQNGWDHYRNPELVPAPNEKPTFDASLGFSKGRKERVMCAREEEMISAKIPLDKRDYCAHHLLKLLKCRRDNWPFAVRCKHENHVYLNCQHEDYIFRMKEYERERRLRARRAESQAQAAV